MADQLPERPHEIFKKHPRSFFSFWRHGFKKAFMKSWEKYGHALIAFGLLYTVGAFWLSRWAKKELWGLDMSVWVTLVVPGVLFAAFVVYHLLRAPYEIYLELHKKYEAETTARDITIKTLSDEIQSIKDAKPELELLPSFSDKDTEGKYFCRIAVKNKSATGTAKLVKVELINISPAPDLHVYSFWMGDVPYPMQLKPAEPEGNIIHPGCTSKFDLFIVDRATTIKDKKEVAYSLSVNFVGRPRFLQAFSEAPQFKPGSCAHLSFLQG
jgi:hypothetical protein